MAKEASSSVPKAATDPKLSPLSQMLYARLDALRAQPPSVENLTEILRLMAKWRNTILSNTVVKKLGPVVQSGPFEGMKYLSVSSEGAGAARLLGSYESCLHPIIEEICARAYRQILDVGCAEGYYAVGLARRMPLAKIIARDTNPIARKKCAQLAELNGVSGQMTIGPEVTHDDFDICTATKTLVVCDIEGGEAQLLDPNLAPGLIAADILVEVHDCYVAGLSAQLAKRFEASHHIQIINRRHDTDLLPDWMHGFSDLDRLIAQWEWRIGPTPWLWMLAKNPPQ